MLSLDGYPLVFLGHHCDNIEEARADVPRTPGAQPLERVSRYHLQGVAGKGAAEVELG